MATGIALILVDENTAKTKSLSCRARGATITDSDIARVEQLIRESTYVLLQLEVNQDANEKVARLAKENGVRVIINTPRPISLYRTNFCEAHTWLRPNEVEAEELTGVHVSDLASADRASKVLLDKGVQNVLITLGGQGVYVHTPEGLRNHTRL